MPTPTQLLAALRSRLGAPYRFGASGPDSFDCSSWTRAALADLGGAFPRHSGDQIAACAPISVEEARRTPGALLWRPGHVGVSTGGPGVLEARAPRAVEGAWTDTYDGGKPRWTKAGLIPGITYTEGSTAVTTKMVSPAQGHVSSEFSTSRKNPATGKIQPHYGIDIANSVGTPVYAPFAGTVVGVGSNLAPGRSGDRNVLIQNPDGERQYFGHLDKALVTKGQKVTAGQQIGQMGARGNVTGPHLHFETWTKAGKPVDPRIYFTHHGVTPGATTTTTKKEEQMNAEQEWIIRNTMSALAATRVMVLDVQNKVNTIMEATGTTPPAPIDADALADALASAIPDSLAQDVVDLLAKRLAN